MALIAIRLSRRPADNRRTFGYDRFEILSAVTNAVALYILYEAASASKIRKQSPAPAC